MPSGGLDFPEIAAVYGRFAALTALSPNLGGHLLLYTRLDRDGIATAIAGNVAGAASLGIEQYAERAKQALRAGVCDFVVNNLDEALRILKNEIRKKRAISVILTGAVDAAVAEIVERGVQPEVLAFPEQKLMERGARLLPEDTETSDEIMTWGVSIEPQRWFPVLDGLAAAAIEAFTAQIDSRGRWIEVSPRYLGRAYSGQRYLWMTEAEADAFVAGVSQAMRSGAIPIAVSVTRGGKAASIAP